MILDGWDCVNVDQLVSTVEIVIVFLLIDWEENLLNKNVDCGSSIMCLVRNELGNKISAPFTLFSYIKGRRKYKLSTNLLRFLFFYIKFI